MAPAKKAQADTLALQTKGSARSKKVEPDDVTINVAVPAELHRALRIRAIEEDMTLRDAISAAIEEWTS